MVFYSRVRVVVFPRCLQEVSRSCIVRSFFLSFRVGRISWTDVIFTNSLSYFFHKMVHKFMVFSSVWRKFCEDCPSIRLPLLFFFFTSAGHPSMGPEIHIPHTRRTWNPCFRWVFEVVRTDPIPWARPTIFICSALYTIYCHAPASLSGSLRSPN